MALILLSLFVGTSSLSCLDASQNSHDYVIMIKAPQVAAVPPQPGKSYLYIDPDHMDYKFEAKALNDSSPLTYTLNQLNLDPSISYVMFK
jgi:Deoxyribonuclease II